MRISPNNRILINPAINPAAGNAAGRPASQTGKPENTVRQTGSKFDTVTIAAENSFQKQLQSKISQEVRTVTTTGTISSLRRQVQSGEYRVNAQNIARKMLFYEEV